MPPAASDEPPATTAARRNRAARGRTRDDLPLLEVCAVVLHSGASEPWPAMLVAIARRLSAAGLLALGELLTPLVGQGAFASTPRRVGGGGSELGGAVGVGGGVARRGAHK